VRIAVGGLIGKLLASGVAEKWSEEIRFTNKFFLHLALFSESIRSKKASVDSWREMLRAFDPTFSSLNDEEVSTLIVLLDYYLQKVESNQAKI